MTTISRPTEGMTLDLGAMGRSAYLDVNGEQVMVALTPARSDRRRDCAVLICPPFGWEELASHRMLRTWARDLADAGYAAARVAYPGTGDSSGAPTDPDRLTAWIASIQAAGEWLRRHEAVEDVIVVGVGLGGLLAHLAAARTEAFDGAVLWAAPRHGREFLRQLNAFARLESSEAFAGLPEPPPLELGALEAGGFYLSPETFAALQAINPPAEPFAHELRYGVLLLGREDRAPDEALRLALVERGVAVSVGPGPGYAALTSHPQDAVLATEVTARVRSWLDERSASAGAEGRSEVRPVPGERAELVTDTDGRSVTERPIAFRAAGIDLRGVLTMPEADPEPLCAVFVNAGAIHRIGPNRMYVETARRWGSLGVPSLRLDIEGVGESDGPERGYTDTARLHGLQLVDQVAGALDELQRRSVAERFVLVGMCSGAYWSLQLALRDPRVVALQLLNLAVIEWDEGVGPARSLRSISLRSFVNLRRADTRARLRAVMRWLLRRLRARLFERRTMVEQEAPFDVRVETTLERLRSSGIQTLLVFAAREPLDRDLTRRGLMAELRSWPNVTVSHLAVASHTLRPRWAQQRARTILDDEITRTLDAVGSRSDRLRRNPSPFTGSTTERSMGRRAEE